MTRTEAVATINKAMASKKYRDPGQEAAMWFAALELALPVLEEQAENLHDGLCASVGYNLPCNCEKGRATKALIAIAEKLEGR